MQGGPGRAQGVFAERRVQESAEGFRLLLCFLQHCSPQETSGSSESQSLGLGIKSPRSQCICRSFSSA